MAGTPSLWLAETVESEVQFAQNLSKKGRGQKAGGRRNTVFCTSARDQTELGFKTQPFQREQMNYNLFLVIRVANCEKKGIF
jgi:hypothetical protein